MAVLGPVEVPATVNWSGAEGKTTEVLVRLALDAGRVVSTDRLIEDLWATRPAPAGTHCSPRCLSCAGRWRAGSAQRRAGRLRSGHRPELRRRAARWWVWLRPPTTARRSGDASTTVASGQSGPGAVPRRRPARCGDGDWLHAQRTRLEEVRMGLLEDQFAARVDLGAGGDVIGELEELVDRYPLREGLWFWLITALYRAGRQADALAAYTRVRSVLVDELGIEPGQALQALETQILQQTPRCAHRRGTATVASLHATGNLPPCPHRWSAARHDLATLAMLTAADVWSRSSGLLASARPAWPSRWPASRQPPGACGWSGSTPPMSPHPSRGWSPRPAPDRRREQPHRPARRCRTLLRVRQLRARRRRGRRPVERPAGRRAAPPCRRHQPAAARPGWRVRSPG